MTDTHIYEEQLVRIVQEGQVRLSTLKPSEWVEQNVVMGEPFPGPYRYSKTPYCREIIDCLAPDNPAKWIAIMKGLQVGLSSGVIIPGLLWTIKEDPCNTYFTVGAPDLVNKAVEKLDLGIDRAGIRNYIKPQVQRRKMQQSGDTNEKKDFAGGYIVIASANNHKNWRDVSLRKGFFDDFEAVKMSSKEAGNTRKLIEGRFAAYADTHKIFYISTPELEESSNILPAYELGDQRKYRIPCPCCHELIELEWEVEGGGGIVFERTNQNQLIESSVGYVCQKCAGFFKENNKDKLLNDGCWQPTAEAKRAGFVSFHLNSLYAPSGMYGWKHYTANYIECTPIGQPRKEDEYKTFVNTTLGLPYKGHTESPKAAAIMTNQRAYAPGIIPDKQSMADGNGRIVLLTCSSDMNGKIRGVNGSDTDDARLDFEVLAHSESGATYSVLHGSIGTFKPLGRNAGEDRKLWTYEHNKPNSVWPVFKEIIQRDWQTDTGRVMSIAITGLDVGYGATIGAYPFLDLMGTTPNMVVGLKGEKEEKYLPWNKDSRLFKKGLERPDLYILSVGVIKDKLSECMNLNWAKGEPQPPFFMNFPQSEQGLYQFDNYFSHYEAEHRTSVKTEEGVLYRWVKKNSAVQNHFWDCGVYNKVLPLIFLNKMAEAWKVKDLTWQEFVSTALTYIK